MPVYISMYVLYILYVRTYIYIYLKTATHCTPFLYVCIYPATYVCTLVPLFYNGFKNSMGIFKTSEINILKFFAQPSILSKMLLRKLLKFNTPLSLLNDHGNLHQ